MKSVAAVLFLIVTLSACDGEALFEPNEITQEEKVNELVGESHVECGEATTWDDTSVNDCIQMSYSNQQSFTATIIEDAVFIKVVHTYAYNGQELYILKSDSVKCSGKTQAECEYFYSVDACLAPEFIAIGDRTAAQKEPFLCSELSSQ